MSDVDDIRQLLSEPMDGITPEMVESTMELVEARERADALLAELKLGPLVEAVFARLVFAARKRLGQGFAIMDGKSASDEEFFGIESHRGGVRIRIEFEAHPARVA